MTIKNRPSFLEGMARVMDVSGALNQYDAADFEEIAAEIHRRYSAGPTGPEAEVEAIRQVWIAVGRHLYDAIGQFEAAGHYKLKSSGLDE